MVDVSKGYDLEKAIEFISAEDEVAYSHIVHKVEDDFVTYKLYTDADELDIPGVSVTVMAGLIGFRLGCVFAAQLIKNR